MATECADTETLVQTNLDGELADSDVFALQAHLAACAECNQLATETARFHARLRERLTPPAAPEHLRGQILAVLDHEDWNARKQRSSRWNWTLPVASSLAAVAALLFFVVSSDPSVATPAVADDAVRQHLRRPPVEVTGTRVSPFVREHFSHNAHVPRFSSSNTGMVGARLSHIGGRDAAQVYYKTQMGNRQYDVSMLMVAPNQLDLCLGRPYDIGGRKLCLGRHRGMHVVSLVNEDGMGYVFISEMGGQKLLDFVSTSDLFLRGAENRQRDR